MRCGDTIPRLIVVPNDSIENISIRLSLIGLHTVGSLAHKATRFNRAAAKVGTHKPTRIGLPLNKIHAKYADVSAETVKAAVICRPLRGDWRFFFHS